MKKALCIFFDFLGTKERFLKLNSLEEEGKIAKKYKEFIKEIRGILTNEIKIPFQELFEGPIKIFSDNIFISLNIEKLSLQGYISILKALSKIQIIAILKYDLLIRGGISIGNIENNKKILIGSGLIKAYELEEKIKYPVIALCDDSIEKYFKCVKQEIKDFYIMEYYFGNNVNKEESIKKYKEEIKMFYGTEKPEAFLLKNKRGSFINYLEYLNNEDLIFLELDYLSDININSEYSEYLEEKNKNFKELILKNHKKFIEENLKIIIDKIKNLKNNIDIKKLLQYLIQKIRLEGNYDKELDNEVKEYEKEMKFSKDENKNIEVLKKYIFLVVIHNGFIKKNQMSEDLLIKNF